jgi:outer membrane immunogenic protein
MRCLSIAIIATVSVVVSTQMASAADMPIKAPVYKAPAPAAVYTWTGFYVGANAGYGWQDPTVTLTPNDPVSYVETCINGGFCPPPASFNIKGALGGLQAGYNWQVQQNWLLGFETDFVWSGIKGTGNSNFFLKFDPSNSQASENVKWFGTVRARIGFLPVNNVLLYATGGLAYGKVGENIVVNNPSGGGAGTGQFGYACNISGPCFLGSSSHTALGWTVGGGLEYALWNNISVKAEYLYVNLVGDSVNVVALDSGGFPSPSSFTANYGTRDFNMVRGGVNLKF